MMEFEDLIRHENAHSGLAFRARAYGAGRHDRLIRDLIGLANASFSGPRFLVLGVDVTRDGRQITGIAGDDFKTLRNLLPRIAARLIEPALKLVLSEVSIEEKMVAVIMVQGCNDPPYLLSCDLSPTMHAGRGWVQRGAARHPLVRDDLLRMLQRSGPSSDREADLSIGFPGKILADEISLPAMPLIAMPSKVAAERIQRMLEGRNDARDAFGRTQTQFNRLLHAQVFGSDHAFEAHSDESLIEELRSADEQHAAADLHYEFEARAHRIQLEIRNNGGFDVDAASLTLTMSRLDGAYISEHLYRAPESSSSPQTAGDAYPIVDASQRRTIVQAEIGRIAAGRSRNAFREPLRLCLRDAAVGKTALVDYKLNSRDLARPLMGSFRIHVEAANNSQKRAAGDAATRPARSA